MSDRDDDHPAGPPPREAIDYLQTKGLRTGWDYREVWREEHNTNWTVANMMQLDLLADVRNAISAAQAEGTTFEQWRGEMAEHLAKRGWWGRREAPDPDDPEAVKQARAYVSRRLRTIWRVNMGQAAQAGAWERGMRSSSHPYVLYRIGPSREHRKEHEAWDGTVLPRDDPFWTVANPRNGWGCKCYTRFVSRAQYERYRRNGISHPAVGDEIPEKGKPIKTELVERPTEDNQAPALQRTTYTNRGVDYDGYKGIDRGFEYNPGAGRVEQLAKAFRAKSATLAEGTAPAGEPASRALAVQADGDLGDSVRRALGAVDAVHGAPGELPPIAIARNDDLPLPSRFRSRGARPTGIELRGDNPYAELLTAHEVGHYLDLAALPGAAYQSRVQSMPEMQELLRAIRDTATWRKLIAGYTDARGVEEKASWLYWLLPQELFARAYAQYVAWKSGDRRLLDQLDARLRDENSERVGLSQWQFDDWLPIAQAMDRLLLRAGWLSES